MPGVYVVNPVVKSRLVDANGNPLSGDDGAAVGTDHGFLAQGKDAGNLRQYLKVAADGTVQIDNSNLDAALSTLATDAKLELVRALLATIDADTSNLDVTLAEIRDTAGVKKITDPLPAGTNEVGAVAQGTKAADSAAWPAKIASADGAEVLDVRGDGDTLTGKHGIPILGRTEADEARWLLVEGTGKLVVASTPPVPPAGTTEIVLAVVESEIEVGTGGDVSSPHTTNGAVIGNALNVYLQLLTAGTEGDPAEAGSEVAVFWYDGTTEKLVDRIYINGASVTFPLPGINKTRDGTAMVGNGTTTQLRVRRTRFSNAAKRIDFVLRGYTQA